MKEVAKYSEIEKNLKRTKRHLENLLKKYGRNAEKIQLLAVSKNHPSTAVRTAYNAGHRQFAENYLQEALQKQHDLEDLEIEWHFIGRIQSNKTSLIANHFSWVHSIERLKIARRLNAQRNDDLPPLNVLIQVNQREETKGGIDQGELLKFSKEFLEFRKLSLRGIMYFPPKGESFEESRESYSKMVKLARKLKTSDILSMGTSDDYEAAVAAGSTLVRLGTTIFGSRNINLGVANDK